MSNTGARSVTIALPTEGVVIWGLAFGALIYMGSNLFARSNVESMLVTYHNNIDDVLQNNANGYGVSVWGLMAGDMTFVTGMNGHEIDWITQEINYPYHSRCIHCSTNLYFQLAAFHEGM